MILSGSRDYKKVSIFHCIRADEIIRLEIYNGRENEITKKWISNGYTVTEARDTPPEIVYEWERKFSPNKNIGYH